MSDPNPEPYRPPAGTGEATPTPAPPAGLGAPGTGGLMFGTQPSVPSQDLSDDKLLATAPRMPMADKPVPALGGIPLLAKLGQGGMGAVYYGIHPRLKLEVAVKVLPFNLAEKNPGLIERFYREANIAARVRSPHLVLVTDVNEDCGLFFLVMEFVRGASAGGYLRTLRQAGRPGLSEATALDICIAATQGLCAAHGEGVIHRDIKPDNIMLPYAKGTEDPLFAAAKLADLGLARGEGHEKSLTGSQSAMGTPGYMAPEQGMDAKAARKPADVFSMGATLYALLSGNAPFVGSSLMKVLLDTAQAPHTPIRKFRPEISEVTEVFLARCLAKDPAQRYPDAFALLEALKVCRKVLGEPQETVKKAVEQLTLLQKAIEVGAPVQTAPVTDTPIEEPDAPRSAAVPNILPTLPPSSPPSTTLPRPSQVTKPWARLMWGALVLLLLATGVGYVYWYPGNSTVEPKVSERVALEAQANAAALLAGEKADAQGNYGSVSEDKRKHVDAALDRALTLKKDDAAAKGLKGMQGDPKELSLDLGEGVKLDLILVPAGKFMMGSPASEAGRQEDEGPQHEVIIGKPFYLGKFEISVGQFKRFVAATGYRTDAEKEGWGYTLAGTEWKEVAGANWMSPGFAQGDNHPVCLVSWNDANAFCVWLTYATGRTARLPREAEWEYACRAGTRTAYMWGDDPDAGKGWANACDLSAKRRFAKWIAFNWSDEYVFTAPVGMFKPNAFGIYDMTGNVLEWCEDRYGKDYYADSPTTDPTGPAVGEYRVLRSGSWGSYLGRCRTSCRLGRTPDYRYSNYGLRVMCLSQTAGLETPVLAERPAVQVPQTPESELKPRAWPLWDGKESVTDYANRAGLEPTKAIDLMGERMELVLIPAGKFVMGSGGDELGRDDDELAHEVTLTMPFYMSKFEVTQVQWESIMGVNPSSTKIPQHPVTQTSWDAIRIFLLKAGNSLQLPTEAQWEYACRAGSTTPFYTGRNSEDLKRAAWFGAFEDQDGNSGKGSNPVGQKQPNGFGLYDMHGNVWEWCHDVYGAYSAKGVMDPQGPADGDFRVIRGGSWSGSPSDCRSGNRSKVAPDYGDNRFGFRVVCPASLVVGR